MYRDYCIEGTPINSMYLALVESPELFGSIILTTGEASYMGSARADSDEYHAWVMQWKSDYNTLSDKIKSVRLELNRTRSEASRTYFQRLLNSYRMLANTMLNARQKARDGRRANRRANRN